MKMKKGLMFQLIFLVLIVLSGCFSQKTNEPKPVVEDGPPEFAIKLTDIVYSSGGAGVTDLIINISAADNLQAGTIYWVATTPGGAAPSADYVREGHDLRLTTFSAVGSVTTSGLTIAAISITGLDGTKDYDLFICSDDSLHNLTRRVTKLHITADCTPPVITGLVTGTINDSSIEITATLDFPNPKGKIYYIVQPGAVATTPSDIKAGLITTGNPVTSAGIGCKSGNVAISGDLYAVNTTFKISSLTRYTNYKIFFVAEDANRNVSSPAAITAQTKDTQMPTYTSAPALTVTSSTPIIANSTAVLTLRVSEDATVYYVVAQSGTLSMSADAVAATTATSSSIVSYGSISVSAGAVTIPLSAAITPFDKEYEVFVVVKDVSNNLMRTSTRLHAYTDFTPPLAVTTLSSVTVSGILSETTAKISVATGEKGKVYYVVVPTSQSGITTTPTNIQVKAYQASTTATVITAKGSLAINGSTSQDFIISGLSRYTDYKVYVIAEDAVASPRTNLQTTVSSIAIQTKDVTAPTFRAAPAIVTGSSITSTAVTITASIDEAGTMYYALCTSSAINKTPVNIRDATSTTAGITACGTIGNPTTTSGMTLERITIGGLTVNTEYDIWVVAVDVFGNIQSTAKKLDAKTVAATATLSSGRVKGVTASLGTPSTNSALVVAGSVTITTPQSLSISLVTSFIATDINATVKVVKYTSGGAITNFATATAYANQTIATGDFFIVRVTAQDGTTMNYYKIVVTISAIPPTAVTATAIAGVTAPVAGATPDTTADPGTGYTGTVTWSGNPVTFALGTTYTAIITLSATAGYTLAGVSANQFTVTGATSATNPTGSGIITAVFPATVPPVTITATAISGVTVPVVGGTPVTTITAGPGYTGTVTWSGTLTLGKFIANTIYTATITLAPTGNYTLTGVSTNQFTVAGTTSDTNAADSGVITAVFPNTQPPTMITAGDIALTAPVTGATPVTSGISGTGYTGTVVWSSGNPTTFVGGVAYTATITLTVAGNYTFLGVGASSFTVSTADSYDNPAGSGAGTTLVVTADFAMTIVNDISVANIVRIADSSPLGIPTRNYTADITTLNGVKSFAYFKGATTTTNIAGANCTPTGSTFSLIIAVLTADALTQVTFQAYTGLLNTQPAGPTGTPATITLP